MAVPTYVAAGAQVAGLGAVTPAFPATVNANDIAILIVETGNQPVAAPTADWHEIVSAGTGTGGATDSVGLQAFWYRCAGTEDAATITVADAGDHQLARIFLFAGCVTTGDPTHGSASAVQASASTAYSVPGFTTTFSDCLVLAGAARGNDSGSTLAFSGEANASLSSLSESSSEAGTTTGTGGGFVLYRGGKATAGTVDATTSTGPSAKQALIAFGLKSTTSTGGTQTLTPSLFTNTASFYAPSVTTGGVVLIPSLLTNTQTFHGPTITVGAVTLTASLFTNSQTFFGPTISTGAVSLAPALLTNAQTFYGPTITAGAVTLTPALLVNTQTFHSPDVAAGAVTLTPALLVNSNVFYSPVVDLGDDQTLVATLLQNTNTFFSPTVALAAAPNLSIGGGVTLRPPRIVTYGKFTIREGADAASFIGKLAATGILAVVEKPDRARFVGSVSTIATMKALESGDAGSTIDWAEYDNQFLLAA